MAQINVDSAALGNIVYEIEQGCFMLGFVNDEDDMDDVHYYAHRIQRAADDLKDMIKKSEPKKGEKHEQKGKSESGRCGHRPG